MYRKFVHVLIEILLLSVYIFCIVHGKRDVFCQNSKFVDFVNLEFVVVNTRILHFLHCFSEFRKDNNDCFGWITLNTTDHTFRNSTIVVLVIWALLVEDLKMCRLCIPLISSFDLKTCKTP